MKKICFILFISLFAIFAFAAKPSLDGMAEVANYGELPSGLFAKSPGYLPGDTVIVTNPQANVSIEVMVFGSFDATEGIAIVLSPEAAKELYITKGSNVIVQVTKKSDAYSENTILSKTLQNYVPTKDMDNDSEMLLEDPLFVELLREKNAVELEESKEVAPLDSPIPLEEILFSSEEVIAEEIVEEIPEEVIAEEVVEDVPEEVIAEEVVEEIPEEVIAEEIVEDVPEEVIAEEIVEEILEEVIAEEIVEEIPEEVIAEEVVEEIPEEVIAEEIVEEIPEELLAEEDLSKIPQTLPDWSEERPIPDFGFSDEIEDSETEEFIAEMDRGIEENTVETTEEIALIPTEPKPPVFTIIPVPVEEEEIIEDDSILEEPEVIFVEEVDEVEDKQENSESEEVLVYLGAKMILNEDDVLEIEEVFYSVVKPVNSLPVDKYYVQIATYSKYENMEAIVKKYGKNYPIVVYQPSGRSDYQVMIGGLNKDEYAIVLERFRKAGFEDAFLRSTF